MTLCFLKKMIDWGRPGDTWTGKPNFSKTAGSKKHYKIICKMLRIRRFQASGRPGTVFEVLGDRSQTRRQAILPRLSAKTAPGQAKQTRLSAKRAMGDLKHTIPFETATKKRRRECRWGLNNIGFQPDCQLKVASGNNNFYFLLRLSAKSCV